MPVVKRQNIVRTAALMLLLLGTFPAQVFADTTNETVCGTVITPAPYTDLTPDDVHTPAVNCAHTLNLIDPHTPDTFGTYTTLTRSEAARALTRFIALTTAPLTTTGETVTFTDITGHPDAEPIRLLAQNGVVNGVTTERFAPDAPITRRQFATMLFNAAARQNAEFGSETRPFADVSAISPVNSLAAANVIRGRASGLFAPDMLLRRGQAASLLVRTATHLSTQNLWQGAAAPDTTPVVPGFTLAYDPIQFDLADQTDEDSPAPQIDGGTATSFSVTGDLPNELTFDTTTGVFTAGKISQNVGAEQIAISRSGSASSSFACARLTDGTVACWGRGRDGQLGDGVDYGINDFSLEPRFVVDTDDEKLTNVVDLSVGTALSCVVTEGNNPPNDNTVRCWGSNANSALGIGLTNTEIGHVTRAHYVLTDGSNQTQDRLKGATQVAAGIGHACALLFNGTVKCWGTNGNGQLGTGTTSTPSVHAVTVVGPGSSPELTGIAAISAGNAFTCALTETDGKVLCWGLNFDGRLGDGTTTESARARYVLEDDDDQDENQLSGATSLSVGDRHACAIIEISSVSSETETLCWGGNLRGRLGDGTTTSRANPVNVLVSGTGSPFTAAAQVSAGHEHTCVTTHNNEVWCWGLNSNRQLADGSSTSPRTRAVQSIVSVSGNNGPIPVAGVAQVSSGGLFTCALQTDASIRCWGHQMFGILGNLISSTSNSQPVLVSQINTASQWPRTVTVTATAENGRTSSTQVTLDLKP